VGRVAAGVGIVAALLGLALLALVLLLLVSVVDRLGAAPRALGSLGAAGASVGQAAQAAAQSARDALDPTHPPRGTLVYDTELDELRIVEPNGTVASHPERDVVLARVEKRVGAESPETAQYGVVVERLKVPRETRVLGVVVSRSDDAHEHVVYDGQMFLVARALYKVNWVQFSPPRMAVGRLRNTDVPVRELAFAVD
jgi:hypothetical protein